VYFRLLLIGYFEGIDATTLEANAAMRRIVRKDTGGMRPTHLRKHENILKRLLCVTKRKHRTAECA